jgi:hypothetical protein
MATLTIVKSNQATHYAIDGLISKPTEVLKFKTIKSFMEWAAKKSENNWSNHQIVTARYSQSSTKVSVSSLSNKINANKFYKQHAK